jgi:hypothetical protein
VRCQRDLFERRRPRSSQAFFSCENCLDGLWGKYEYNAVACLLASQVWLRIYIYIYLHKHIYIYIQTYIYICTYMYMRTHIYIYVQIYICVCTHSIDPIAYHFRDIKNQPITCFLAHRDLPHQSLVTVCHSGSHHVALCGYISAK